MRTVLFTSAIVFGLAASFSLAAGCSSATCEESNSCGSPTDDAGPEASGDGGGVDAPEGCDPNADVKDAPKCVVNEFGAFVDSSGDDANPGTRESPVKTIGAALGKLGGKPRIYVCEGTYAEHVKLTSAVSIYGGFACGSWTYSATAVKLAPSDPGYVLHIDSVAGAVTIADLSLTAANATEKGASSIAAFVNASPKVTFLRSNLEAGDGKEGADGEAGTTGTVTMVSAGNLNANGNPATAGTTAGLQKVCTCSTGGTSTGAAGGGPNGAGALGQPNLGAGAGGAASKDCTAAEPNGTGDKGGNAATAADADSITELGALDATGWVPKPGQAGKDGVPGQGGGGGGGYDGTSAGGGGGCGGCGGSGGKPGSGGGASVALVAVDSPLILRNSSLTAKTAASGGKGGGAGAGATGGVGAGGGPLGCQGGTGGRGGDGGAGGGGAGGVSVGVLYKGSKPTLDATKVTTGLFGAKGPGGKIGTNDGIDGQAAETLEIK